VSLIDIHSHVVPNGFPGPPSACTCGRWPSLEHRGGDRAAVVIGGRDFRAIDDRSWDVGRRVADMDADGISIQALSPMPELLSHWLDAASALEMAHHVNGAIAGMTAEAPGRLVGLGMVPMQAPELAARELERLKADGFAGIEIGSNINGLSPADPRFDVVYAEAERLGLAVFVHALKPLGTDRLVGPAGLEALIAFPVDTGLAVAGFITGGVLERFPRLRVAFSHGGGALSAILPRLASGWAGNEALRAAFPSPVETARRLFYDSLVYDPTTLRHLIGLFGASRIMAGTDYPYAIRQPDVGAWLDGADLTPDEAISIRGGTARRFLGL
jgi:aminocarboxymuconate-semialdehyde decarboxylase